MVIIWYSTFSGGLREKNDCYLSTKHDGYGLGLSSVASIAEKYGGLVDFSADKTIFHASIFIPLTAHVEEPVCQ